MNILFPANEKELKETLTGLLKIVLNNSNELIKTNNGNQIIEAKTGTCWEVNFKGKLINTVSLVTNDIKARCDFKMLNSEAVTFIKHLNELVIQTGKIPNFF